MLDLPNLYRPGITFAGCVAQQSSASLATIEAALDYGKPRQIIEIGTGHGGLTLYLGTWALHNDAHVHTFDNHDKLLTNTLRLFNRFEIQRHIADVFDDTFTLIIKLLASDEPTMLFCDGGNKHKELIRYAGLVKPGDVVGCHDWASEVCPTTVSPMMAKLGYRELFDGKEVMAEGYMAMFWQRVTVQ